MDCWLGDRKAIQPVKKFLHVQPTKFLPWKATNGSCSTVLLFTLWRGLTLTDLWRTSPIQRRRLSCSR